MDLFYLCIYYKYFNKGLTINFFELRGVGAMEIVAMDMKLRGAYIARQLSFQGVSFTIEEVPLTNEFKSVYDESVQLVNTKLILRQLNLF